MTYLQAINKVLRRLREEEVNSPTDTAYAKLIGEFVNDAVRIVENAWDWADLRTTLQIDAYQGVSQYTLSNVNSNFKILTAYDTTDKTVLRQGTSKDFKDYFYLEGAEQSRPTHYLFDGFADDDDTSANIRLYPTPDKAYTITLDVVDRNIDLRLGSQAIPVAALAVVQFAHAMAAEERGEVGGTQSARLYQMAQSTLSDAIAYDAARFPTETVWSDV
jgi:hypothetical protein